MAGFYASVARWYDAEHADKVDDLAFYGRLLAERGGGPLLDVGCGSGRVLFHLADALEQGLGIEREEAMLARARRRLRGSPWLAERLRFLPGDVLEITPRGRMRYVLLSYNMLMHFHGQERQLALLRRLREWLAKDGLLVIDLPNAGETFATADSEALTLERSFLDPESGHLVMQQASSRLDRVTQLMRVTWVYDEVDGDGLVRRVVAPVVFRHFFWPELALLLRLGGFAVEAVFGDYECGPWEDGCPRMIALARPA